MTDNIVAEKTNGAAREPGQVWLRHKTEPAHRSLQGYQRLRGLPHRGDLSIFLDGHRAIFAPDYQTRIESEKRISARLRRLLGRFKQERMPAFIQFVECRGGCLAIRDEVHEDRDDITEPGQVDESFARRDDGDVGHDCEAFKYLGIPWRVTRRFLRRPPA